MKKCLFIFTLMLGCLAFVSCSDDDDGGSSSPTNNIVGTWVIDLDYTLYPYIDFGGGESTNMCSFIQFQKDGTSIRVLQPDFNDTESDSEVNFGTYKTDMTSGYVLIISEEDFTRSFDYYIAGNKLFISYYDFDNVLRQFVYRRTDDSAMDKYFTKRPLEDYEVNIDKFKMSAQDLEPFKVDLSDRLIDISDKKVELTPIIPDFGCPDDNHPHVIDMGDAGEWACCNVGANHPVEFGGYYAWAETEEKKNYFEDTYKYYNPAIGKYKDIGDDIAGTSYDVAHVKWGGKWVLPSKERIEALLNYCIFSIKEYPVYEEDTNDCFLINGDIYRLDNIDPPLNYYYIIGGKLYFLGDIGENYRLIDGTLYKNIYANNWFAYYTDEGVCRFDMSKKDVLYDIGDKVYEIKDFKMCYTKDNDIYTVKTGIVRGIDKLKGTLIFSFDDSNKSNIRGLGLNLRDAKLSKTVFGTLFISRKTRNSVFFPAADFRYEQYDYTHFPEMGRYLSSTPNLNFYYDGRVYVLEFSKNSDPHLSVSVERFCGLSARPVVK